MCVPGLHYAHLSLIVLILFFGGLVSGSAVNRTIDDVFGDRVTGDLVQYLPEVPASEGPLWFNQTSCSGCAGVPDASLTLDNTWSAARYLADIGSMSLSMKFSGTAIYVFFVIPNFAAGTGLASAVLCDFFIDGAAVGSFSHESDGSGAFAYNTLVYRNTSIPAGDHVLLIETTGADPAVIIFDYALYTDNVPDAPDPSPSQHSTVSVSSSSPAEPPSSTAIAPHEDTGTPTSLSPSSTATSAAPAFPTSAEATTISLFSTSIVPFLLTVLPSDSDSAPLPTTPPSVNPADASNEGASRRSISVIAIIGAVVGAVVLIILVLLFLMLCRRRRQRAQQAATGTISVFDLLNDSPPPPLSLQPSLQPSSQSSTPQSRRRPLPAPPMSQNPGGRSVGATQTKTETPVQTPVAGPSGFNFRAEETFAGPSGAKYHSAQSSVSVSNYSSDSYSDLRIHIPMTSFRQAYSPHSPATHTPSPSHTPSNSHSHSLAHSHDHSASYGHGHSPITRNGVPMQPAHADIVRDIVLGALMVDRHEASLRRGSEDSGYTQTAEGREIDDDDEIRGEPVVHVDSGIRFSRVVELPPAYAAR